MRINLSTPLVTASVASRTISGRIVTFNEVGNTSAGPTRFAPGSIHVPDTVRLNLEHDRTRPIGLASVISSGPTGLDASFKIAGTRAGDDSLIEAAEGLRSGFSVGVEATEHTYDGDVLVVTASHLDHVALTTDPAIKTAIVHDVAATEQPETPEPAPADPVAPEPEEIPVPEATEPAAVVEATTPAPTLVPVPGRTLERFPYTPTDTHLSLFRDMVNSRHDIDAADRSRKAQRMMVDAAMTSVIPPGYRPDLYVSQIQQGAPLSSLLSQYTIPDATAFTVPSFTSGTALVADNVSGTNPTPGTIATGSVSVTPKPVSGILDLPREMIDASNPALDQIGLAAMLEEYVRDFEADVCTAVVAGATAGTNGPTTKYVNSLMKNIAAFPATRFAPATAVAVGPTLFQELAMEEDTAGRAKLPWHTPVNSAGSMGAAAAALEVAGLAVVGCYGLPVQQGLVLKKEDAAVFASGPQFFRWEEIGPSNIRLAIWGYVGVAVLRAVGVLKYTQTA